MKTDARGAVGMYPIRADALCISCKERLAKKHGLNQNRDGEPTVMGWFVGGTGPRCIWCHQQAWQDREFWARTGSSEYSARRWDLERDFRPK